MATKFLNWFISPKGRVAVGYLAGVASTGIVGLYMVPHSALLDKHQEIVQLYNVGKPVPTPGDVERTATEVLMSSNLSVREKALVKFFTVFGYDVYHAGSSQLKTGAIIGLPSNFYNYKAEQFETERMMVVNSERFSWTSPLGKELIESLIFSKEAKKFAIARELAYVNTHYVYVNSFSAGYTFFMTYLIGRWLNTRWNLYSRLRAQRLVLYGLLSLVGCTFYLIVHDAINTYYEGYSDKVAADRGAEYAQGGLEFYEKLLARNLILRRILGSKGESMFTAGGNVNEFVRVSQIPFTARRDYFEKRISEYKQKKRGNFLDE